MPKTSKINLPTVISSSVILNAVVRAAESAAEQLGSDYHSIIRRELFKSVVAVYKDVPIVAVNPLDTSQSIANSDGAIWSMELASSVLEKACPIFSKNPPKYFFLNNEEALAYIKKTEELTVELIVASAANSLKEKI